MLAVGDKAPQFVAMGTNGEVDLGEILDRGPVVLYFFPRAMTGGCTTEALEFDELLSEFTTLGVTVMGVSVDTVQRQQRFRDNYGLKFDLVSDHNREIGMAYGTLVGDATTSNERDTVVIADDGTILLTYQRATAKGHARNVLDDVSRLRSQGLL